MEYELSDGAAGQTCALGGAAMLCGGSADGVVVLE